MLAASHAFGLVPGLSPCGPSGGLGAVMAFELARTPAEVAALFGEGACRAALEVAQRRAIWIDTLFFIPAYAAFLLLGIATLGARSRLALAGMAAVVLAAAGDLIESAVLALLLGDLADPAPLAPLYWIVRAKFALLSVAGFAIGALLVRHATAERLAAVPVLGGTLLSAALVATNPHHPMLTDGFRLAWTTLLAVAAWRCVRPAPSSG